MLIGISLFLACGEVPGESSVLGTSPVFRAQTGHGTVASTSDGAFVLAVLPTLDQVAVFDVETWETWTFWVGEGPARITRIGEHFGVTLRGGDAVALVAPQGLISTHEACVEPVGIEANEGGDLFYLACSGQDEVQEWDGKEMASLRSWPVPDQPRWVALHPQGDLYVGTAMGRELVWIDLDADSVVGIDLPETLNLGEGDDDPVAFTPRMTGDLALSPGMDQLAVPVLYVDNDLTDPGDGTEAVPGTYVSQEASVAHRGVFSPAVVTLDVDRGFGGAPSDGQALSLISVVDRQGTGRGMTVRSYPSAAAYTPSGGVLLASIEGAAALTALVRGSSATPAEASGWFGTQPTLTLPTGDGTASVVFVSAELGFAHGQIGRDLTPLRPELWTEDLTDQRTGVHLGREAESSFALTQETLGAWLEEGRHLFHTSVDSDIVDHQAGVSCSTCHFEGRTDGLTWALENGPRNTPSLAGHVSETAPFTWADDVPTVGNEALLTSDNRMGGSGLGVYQSEFLALWIDQTPAVSRPAQDAEAVMRGAALFERDDVACADCHPAPLYTDLESHALFGDTAIDTPSLLGVGATAPYLHDGSSELLEALLRRPEMGGSSDLTEAEREDLAAYLRAL